MTYPTLTAPEPKLSFRKQLGVNLARLLLRLTGWRTEVNLPFNTPRMVIVAAPHTSNWDYFYGLIGIYGSGLFAHWPYGVLIKNAVFKPPFGAFFRAFGGIPVNRDDPRDLVQQVVDVFNKSERLMLAMSPEGTRKQTGYWKTGFYRIALSAQVPVVLGTLDYAQKVFRISAPFMLTGDPDVDLATIQQFYANVTAKHPEKFSAIRFKPKGDESTTA